MGANVNAQGEYYGNPLYISPHSEALLKLLIGKAANVYADNGADENVQGEEYGNALQAVSHNSHGAIAKLVIQRETL
jgi:hypothetical protein